jgi:hypothetical protein
VIADIVTLILLQTGAGIIFLRAEVYFVCEIPRMGVGLLQGSHK